MAASQLALDAGRDDKKLVAQLQTLIAQRPDAVIQTLGTPERHRPLAQEAEGGGHSRLHGGRPSSNSINNATSDNFNLGSNLALRLVSDIGGEGNVVVFNGYHGVPVCAIRYDELKEVLKYYPAVKIIQPELRDVIPNTVQDAVTEGDGGSRQISGQGIDQGDLVSPGYPPARRDTGSPFGRATGSEDYGVDGTPEVVELIRIRTRLPRRSRRNSLR